MRLTTGLAATFALLFLLTSCGGPAGPAANEWLEGTTSYTLQGARTQIKLPPTFIKSSPYRLEKDLPALKKDQAAQFITRQLLDDLEAEHEDVDILIDTSATIHYFLLVGVDKITVDADAGTVLNSQQGERFKKLKKRLRGLQSEKVMSNLKEGADRKALKYKYRIKNGRQDPLFLTNYMITTPLRTYLVYELSRKETDLENYLWTLNE